LSLLEYNNDVVDKADQLSRRASNYITRHDLISSKISDRDISEDADRLLAAHEALAGFRFAVEHSQPNSRVRTLGLAWKSRLCPHCPPIRIAAAVMVMSGLLMIRLRWGPWQYR
jgi:hypothetical protein